jgi:hypothetical protein
MSPDVDAVFAVFERLRAVAQTLPRNAPAVRADLDFLYQQWRGLTEVARRLLAMEGSLIQEVTAQRDALAARVQQLEAELAMYERETGVRRRG